VSDCYPDDWPVSACVAVDEAHERIAELEDKAIRYDLDCAGIAQREREAIELVEARARIAELERQRNIAESTLESLQNRFAQCTAENQRLWDLQRQLNAKTGALWVDGIEKLKGGEQ